MPRQRPSTTGRNVGTPGLHERNLASKTGLRFKRESIPMQALPGCIGKVTCTNVDVLSYVDGPAYTPQQTTAAARASYNPFGMLPIPCTPAVTLVHQIEEATGATGAGRANNGSQDPARTFQVKLFGFDPWGNAIEEELPEQTVDDPSHAWAKRVVYCSKIFARITRWQYKYTNMNNAAGGLEDSINIGFEAYWNRNRPIYIWQNSSGGSFTLNYKGQSVVISRATLLTRSTLITAIETLPNVGAGDVLIDSPSDPSGVAGGIGIAPWRIWFSNAGAGSGTPLLGTEAEDREFATGISVDGVTGGPLTGGKAAIWLSTPRYINQENAGIWLPWMSDVYGKDLPYEHPEFVTAVLEVLAQQGAGSNAGTLTDPTATASVTALRDDLIATTIPSIEARLSAITPNLIPLSVGKNTGNVRTSAGLDLGLNAAGSGAKSEPGKISLYLERFKHDFYDGVNGFELSRLHEDVTILQEKVILHLLLRTTLGTERDSTSVSSYVNG